ncbi:hypothetical protein Agub_g4524 [Astrephomene gubernaculifera]|uniref:Uncharacterized protein n=1 Tax=Astrephomene gubernaculifera TaxID=47775 RepID=A0AAD3DME8_9CHLO|nr:hypothetical protein Agub_g4524 [Astrephomene gubernaculifera]
MQAAISKWESRAEGLVQQHQKNVTAFGDDLQMQRSELRRRWGATLLLGQTSGAGGSGPSATEGVLAPDVGQGSGGLGDGLAAGGGALGGGDHTTPGGPVSLPPPLPPLCPALLSPVSLPPPSLPYARRC